MAQPQVTVCCSVGDERREVTVPLGQGVQDLRRSVQAALPQLRAQDFVLTDCNRDLSKDADLRALQPGQKLWALDVLGGLAAAPAKERISFNPHPKTLTMAGDYEYFAAQGKSPFPFAIAELVDNSLRALQQGRKPSGQITVSMVLNNLANPSAGLLSVWDNGAGMTKLQLNQWAVMNLSMEDRGLQPREGAEKAPAGVGRFLAGNLSYFGVGSKNAAFYLGKCVKMATKQGSGRYVHELSISAAELEQRYKQGEAVYEDDLLHRNPGDASTMLPMEAGFPIARSWVQQEGSGVPALTQAPSQVPSSESASFTRVVIGQLKSDILRQISEDLRGQKLCRALAHLYHYYLHGEEGSRVAGGQPGSTQLTGRGTQQQQQEHGLPKVVIECYVGSNVLWRVNLADVEDDLKSRYQRAQQAQLRFTLEVADKGTVAGALYYFPFQGGSETLPMEDSTSFDPGDSTVDLTQGEKHTQATQAGHQADREEGEGSDGRMSLWQRSRAPLLECYWQGRLIPGARVESLPFIEAVRLKRRSSGKDALPDEVFLRLRGALFFGPGFLVTRNKLNFRDNLLELLSAAIPGDRNIEKRFRKWLGECHGQLDKHIRFEGLGSAELQAAAKDWCGSTCTAFNRVTEGSKVVATGDVVRLSGKPALLGSVLCFTVNKVVAEEGVYAQGSVTVQPYPIEAWGTTAYRTLPLRRLEAVVTDDEGQDFCSRELKKMPAKLALDPEPLDPQEAITCVAGDTIPEASVSILNGHIARITRAQISGDKQALIVTQRLWRIREADGSDLNPSSSMQPQSPPRKQPRKRKGKSAAAAAEAEAAAPDAALGKLVLEVENATPVRDAYLFSAVQDGLNVAGEYRLQYSAGPVPPGQPPITAGLTFIVSPGVATSMALEGEGKLAAITNDLLLGQHLPPLELVFYDAHSNTTAVNPDWLDDLALEVMQKLGEEPPAIVPDLAVVADMESQDDATGYTKIHLLGVHILGSPSHTHAHDPLPSLLPPQAPPAASNAPAQGEMDSQQGVGLAEVGVCVVMPPLPLQFLAVRVRPGAPHSLSLLSPHPWQNGEQAAEVPSDSQLPAFTVQAVDLWNNRAGCSEGLTASVVLKCSALEPNEMEVPLPESGTARFAGLKALAQSAEDATLPVPLQLALKLQPDNVLVEAAVEVASPLQPLELGVRVLPSSAPTSLVLSQHGSALPIQEAAGEEGPVATLADIAAGSTIEGLTFQCLDEAGRPAAVGSTGKVQVSWTRGSKKVKLKDGAMPLPPLPVAEQVEAVAQPFWVRFTGAGSPGFTLETGLAVTTVPGSPAVWSMTCTEGSSQCSSEEGADIRCNSWFCIEVEAMDDFCNSCGGKLSDVVPTPRIVPEGQQPLEWDEAEWQQGWQLREGGEVWAARLKLRGMPGSIRIHVKDEAGPDKASQLKADFLDLNLAAGAPTKLAFEGPPALSCSTRAVLGLLRVKATDIFGNLTTHGCSGIEVELQPGEPGREGTSCVVSAANNNVAKLRKGIAAFREVSFAAEGPGAFSLVARSLNTAKLDANAILTVNAAVTNWVTALQLTCSCLAASAGDCLQLLVAATTEDDQGITAELAAEGITISLNTPDNRRIDATFTQPDSHNSQEGGFTFVTEPLEKAGSYVATAEYVEHRAELAEATHTGRGGLSCTHPVEIEVTAGTASHLQPSSSLPDRLSITNGQAAEERKLLPGVTWQLQDAFGNGVHLSGIPVKLALEAGGRSFDGQLPSLQAESGLEQETDSIGKVCFGRVEVAKGSGRVTRGGSQGAAELQLSLQVPGSSISATTPDRPDGQVCAWQATVLFSDDAAQFAAMQQLTRKHAQLTQQKGQLQQKQQEAAAGLQQAQAELRTAEKAAERLQRGVQGAVPDTAAEASSALEQLRQQPMEAAGGDDAAALEASYGPPHTPMTASIDWCLQQGNPEVVGVMAQLLSIGDESLAQVLSTHLRGLISVVVLASASCRDRLRQQLQARSSPIPDFLCLSHTQPFKAAARGEVPGLRSASSKAQAMMSWACAGSEPLLNHALPHTRVLSSRKDNLQGLELGPNDWPPGCLGYAFNLVRPTSHGHRASVLYTLLGSILVFETLEHASGYREYMTQVLKASLSDVLTLDLKRITAKGITSGSSFTPAALADSPVRFSFTPPGSSSDGGAAAREQQQGALERLVEGLQAREAAEAAAEAAQQAADEAESEAQPEVQRLEAAIATLDAELAAAHGLSQRGQDKGSSRPSGKRISNSEQVDKPSRRKGLTLKKRASGEHTPTGDENEDGNAPARSRRRLLDMESD